MLNKLTVTELAQLSNLSKSYISQVKHGLRPPSEKLLEVLDGLDRERTTKKDSLDWPTALSQFLASRREGTSPNTLRDYRITLSKTLPVLGLKPTTEAINRFLSDLPCSLGGKYGYFKCMRAFYNWAYSPPSGLGLPSANNPVTWVDAPKPPKLILPSLTTEQVRILIEATDSIRDKAIVSLLTESGLRLSELANVRVSDIDWQSRTVKTLGKGQKEALAPFGDLSERYLKEWLAQYEPCEGVWDLNRWGIVSMLNRLEKRTGLPCNPHTFRRTFACLLRKAGVDTMTIKDLGRWESLEMVQRYTRSVTFEDSLKFYKPPLSS